METTISVNLKIWRQRGPKEKGQFVNYHLDGVSTGSSFLEMLDMLNQQLVEKGEEPVVFDSDCREGICGMCSLYINGHPHGPVQGITTCQLHMRKFNDGDTITIEPWRSAAFPVIRDLMVDRNAFDKIQQAGGYVSFNCGGAPDANATPISKEVADVAMDSATCIGCGACVAACKNGSAMLFVSAKVSQFALLPQGQVERARRAGYKMQKDGYRTLPNGKKFTLRFLYEGDALVARNYMEQWKKIGVKVKLKDDRLQNFNTFTEELLNDGKGWDLWMSGWDITGAPTREATSYAVSSPYNFAHFATKENTALIDSLSSEKAFDQDYQLKQFYKWQAYMNKEAYVVPRDFEYYTNPVSKKVKGYTVDPEKGYWVWSNVSLTK